MQVGMEQFLANGLCRGSVYALAATGFGLIYTTSGVFHIAHGAIYTIGAYSVYLAAVVFSLPLAGAVLLALAVSAGLGVFVERVVYSPLEQRSAPPLVLMISSLGAYILLANLVQMGFGSDLKVIPSRLGQTMQIGSVILTYAQGLQLACGVVVLSGYGLLLRKSLIGIAGRAVADDPSLASALGVSVPVIRAGAFAAGSALAALAAILVGLDVGMEPTSGFPAVLTAAVACILGGLRRFLAPALGGFALALTQQIVISRTSANWESLVTFSLLVLFLLFRPQGLLGIRRQSET